MHKHMLRPVISKHTRRTLYFECEICCDHIRITRGNYRKMFTQLRNPRHQLRFKPALKQGGTLDVSRKAWRGK